MHRASMLVSRVMCRCQKVMYRCEADMPRNATLMVPSLHSLPLPYPISATMSRIFAYLIEHTWVTCHR